MVTLEDKQNELATFQSGPLENLTIQDALIISALFAVEADLEKLKRISEFAQKHPLFVEKSEDTSARVNKFANLMQGDQSLKAVEAATRALKPKHRQQAFEFAIKAALADKRPLEKKKKLLQMLAAKLELEDGFVGQKLAKIKE